MNDGAVLGDSEGAAGEAVDALRTAIKGKVSANIPAADLVSFRVGGPVLILVEPEDTQDLARIGEVLGKHRLHPLVAGRGTNLLIADRGYEGVIIRLGKAFEWIRSDGLVVEAGGGTPLPQVSNRAARLCLGGLEFAIAIPAAVGGAVRMNAGAHGASISDVLESAVVCDLTDGTLRTVGPDDLRMTYRQTVIGSNHVVCSARFRLQRAGRAEIAGRMKKYRSHRTKTQPAEAPNAGSMFRNPEGDAAGRLIEAAGLKGFRVGDAEVSTKHANFFLAHPDATAQQIYDLMARVQAEVQSEFGVLLVPEIKIAGEFDESLELRMAE